MGSYFVRGTAGAGGGDGGGWRGWAAVGSNGRAASVTNAMARQMKAERERRAVITEADGEKQAQITRAEGGKQAAILEAEGRREAAFRDAEARERAASAEAQATKVVSDAIEGGSVNALNYFVAQKYVVAFGKLAESPQQKTVIVPAEMSALVGALAGIQELVTGAHTPGAPGQAPPPRPRRDPPPAAPAPAVPRTD